MSTRTPLILAALVVLSCAGKSETIDPPGGGEAGTSGLGGSGGAGESGNGGFPTVCEAGSFICTGDVLIVCITPEKGYEAVAVCEHGMCNATQGQCDTCTPSQASCLDDRTVSYCDAFGRSTVHGLCATPTPYCVDDGLCVECADNSHCPMAKSECMARVCQSNHCGYAAVANGAACGQGGVCEGGLCSRCTIGDLACNSAGVPVVCDAEGNWIPETPCAAPYPTCVDGVCVKCQSVSQCPQPGNECMSAACDSEGECGFVQTPAGSPCSDQRQCDGLGACNCEPGAKACNGDTPRTCNADGTWTDSAPCSGSTAQCSDGSCVQCISSYHCPAPPVCFTAQCNANTCSQSPSALGATCPGGVCNGSGSCLSTGVGGSGGSGGSSGGANSITGLTAVNPSYEDSPPLPRVCPKNKISVFGTCFGWPWGS